MSLRQALVRRLRRWAVRRHGIDALPHTLVRRRIYILPTRFGLMLAVLIVAMLIAGLNYGSNLALAFGFLMASLAVVTMHHCHRNLQGLVVDADLQYDAPAQSEARLVFRLINQASFERYDVEVHCDVATPAVISLHANSTNTTTLILPTATRGIVHLAQWELRTRQPFAWFRAWTYVNAPLMIFVAPQARGARALPAVHTPKSGEVARTATRGADEFAGLRAYRPGDALKHMAWKVVARGQPPAVRQYEAQATSMEWLDWSSLPDLAPEPRLQQLARWIWDQDSAGRRYGLRLPGLVIAPTHGLQHRRACLRALAGFDTTTQGRA